MKKKGKSRLFNKSVRDAKKGLRRQSKRVLALPGDNGKHGKGKAVGVKLTGPKGFERG